MTKLLCQEIALRMSCSCNRATVKSLRYTSYSSSHDQKFPAGYLRVKYGQKSHFLFQTTSLPSKLNQGCLHCQQRNDSCLVAPQAGAKCNIRMHVLLLSHHRDFHCIVPSAATTKMDTRKKKHVFSATHPKPNAKEPPACEKFDKCKTSGLQPNYFVLNCLNFL